MRKPPLGPTTPQRVVPCVLLVGGDPSLESTLRQCAALAAGARLEVCDVASVTTCAAEWRPFAIIVPQEILEFDPAEFIALARTVKAELVPLAFDQADAPRFKQGITASLRAAYQHKKQPG